ncbi:MAG: class I SAM-dependent methyltransferase [Christensenellales bacterium]
MQKFLNEIKNENNFKYTFSSPFDKNECKKIVYRKVEERETYFQQEKFVENKVFHENIDLSEIENKLMETFSLYKQCCIQSKDETINVFNFDGKIVLKRIKASNKCDLSHNKQKEYFINEYDDVPVLRELGIFTLENKIVASKYDKFKQINRFIEIIDDKLNQYNKKEINIIDFGCGKSYLTFVLYYYLTSIRKIKANISGYDLKSDVVTHCNKLAKKYGYENLNFYNEDVANVKTDNNVDMLITLHACDTATDFALNFAINSKIKYIFSVPCCQHEINLSIKKGGEFDCFLSYGLIKERFSSLLTDTIRAKVLECKGYKVDILEFVDFSHTPKNLMIRAERVRKETNLTENLLQMQKQYSFKQKLLELQVNDLKLNQ